MIEVMLDESGKYLLYTAYLMLFLVLAEVNALFNGTLAFICASLYVKLIRACCAIEERISLPPEEARMAVRYAYGMIAWQVFGSSWSFFFNTGGGLDVDILGSFAEISPFIHSLILALKHYGVIQLSIWTMIPRLWMAYFARTLRCYLKAIGRDLERAINSTEASPQRIIRHMDITKSNLERIKMASGLASRIVSLGFMFALVISAINVSVAVHCSSTGTTLSPRTRIYFAGWTLLQVVNLMCPVLSWQRIKRQVAKIRYIVQSFELPEGAPAGLSERVSL
ncbi:hypothetical protein V5799_000317 [Amblyomma americanum]|uniref:Uncharacterized protein n=1 Tax=Amblyomma americanum TaxID=6943 RepID=A0AAQ4D3E5_AMBAM